MAASEDEADDVSTLVVLASVVELVVPEASEVLAAALEEAAAGVQSMV